MVFNLTSLLSAVFAAAAAAQPAPLWVERQTYVMGTVLSASVAAPDRETAIAALEAAFTEVRRLDVVLSTWSTESAMTRVNAAAGMGPVELSSELTHLLAEAGRWREETEGAFDPSIGSLIDLWDLRGEGRAPSAAELEAVMRHARGARYHLNAEARTILLRSGEWLDTGGFGKGAALRAAQRVLQAEGATAGRLNFGGQLLVYGTPPTGDRFWKLGVAHPADRDRQIAWVKVRGTMSVATSAQSERFVEVEGRRFGHIIDPRRGRPVTAWGSATVITEDAMVADALSTALLVMGPDEGRRWASNRPEGVLLMEALSDGEVMMSWNAAFERYRSQCSNLDES